MTEFSVSFYRPWLGGMSKRTSLIRQFTAELARNRIDKIDFRSVNEEDFRKKIASITFYMVKYMSTINIKQGAYNSPTNVLYANLPSGDYSNEFII